MSIQLAGDSISQHNGQEFSTYDADHDTSSSNCAVKYQGAWWFSGCGECVPNGVYNSTTYCTGVNWWTWKANTYSLMKTELKIRPSI